MVVVGNDGEVVVGGIEFMMGLISWGRCNKKCVSE